MLCIWFIVEDKSMKGKKMPEFGMKRVYRWYA